MKHSRIVFAAVLLTSQVHGADPLPSWNATGPRQAILQFVEKATKKGSAHFVPEPERIATFDNDGCLWAEQPMRKNGFKTYIVSGGGIEFMRPWTE